MRRVQDIKFYEDDYVDFLVNFDLADEVARVIGRDKVENISNWVDIDIVFTNGKAYCDIPEIGRFEWTCEEDGVWENRNINEFDIYGDMYEKGINRWVVWYITQTGKMTINGLSEFEYKLREAVLKNHDEEDDCQMAIRWLDCSFNKVINIHNCTDILGVFADMTNKSVVLIDTTDPEDKLGPGLHLVTPNELDEDVRKKLLDYCLTPIDNDMILSQKHIKLDLTKEENIVKLFNTWAEDRGAMECEYVYDIQNIEDFNDIAKMYGLGIAVSCYYLGYRFWLGGTNYNLDNNAFNDNKWNKPNILRPFNAKEYNLEDLLSCIEERMDDYLCAGCTIEVVSSYYNNLINVEQWNIDRNTMNPNLRETFCTITNIKMEEINSIEVAEKKYGFTYFYVTYDNEQKNNCILEIEGETYCTTNGCYPANIDDARMYIWVNKSGEKFYLTEDFSLHKLSEIMERRLIALNKLKIDEVWMDGVICDSFTENSISFYNYGNINQTLYTAHYYDYEDVLPQNITIFVNFSSQA